MTERPIIFSKAMVQAILEGRKIQTRRVVKKQPPKNAVFIGCREGGSKTGFYWCDGIEGHKQGFFPGIDKNMHCPYGEIGDRLWVRETFSYKRNLITLDLPIYKASTKEWQEGGSYWMQEDGKQPIRLKRNGQWKPSIYMPRAAARIFLEITNIRVERVQDISEMDAIKEGVLLGDGGYWHDYEDDRNCFTNAKSSFKTLWRSINGKEVWEDNPWVWVIEFKKL